MTRDNKDSGRPDCAVDKERFKRLVMPFYPRLLRVASYVLDDGDDAHDAVQEVYYRLWHRRNEILSQAKDLEPYCVAMVRNQCLDMIRKRRAELDLATVDDVEGDDTERRYEGREALAVVGALVERLPARQREVMLLRCAEGREISEIAHLTGDSEGNVRVLLSRARKRIREMLNEMENG